MSERSKQAETYFKEGYNCCQAVVLAFADEVGLEKETALKIAASFGGGMGLLREVCGAVSGALMALGIRFGYCTPNDMEGKQRGNGKAIEFINAFREQRGTLLCKELLGYNPGIPEDMQKINQLGLHNTVCPQAITDAVEIAGGIIEQG